MKDYILLLPIIFIFHDMEEIVGLCRFFRKNPWLYDRFPRIMKAYQGVTNEGFSAAVYEEFIPFFGISLVAYCHPNKILCAIWFGIFLSLTSHFLVHIGHTVYLKRYIPSFVTSVICLPVSIFILVKCSGFMTFAFAAVMIIAASVLLMMMNLRLAHTVMHYVNKRVRN